MADHPDLANSGEPVFLDIELILTTLERLFLLRPLTPIQEVSWEKSSKCARLTPSRTLAVLLGVQ
jgi:hypothetical protein